MIIFMNKLLLKQFSVVLIPQLGHGRNFICAFVIVLSRVLFFSEGLKGEREAFQRKQYCKAFSPQRYEYQTPSRLQSLLANNVKNKSFGEMERKVSWWNFHGDFIMIESFISSFPPFRKLNEEYQILFHICQVLNRLCLLRFQSWVASAKTNHC